MAAAAEKPGITRGFPPRPESVAARGAGSDPGARSFGGSRWGETGAGISPGAAASTPSHPGVTK